MQVVVFCTKYDRFNAIYVNAVNATIFVHNFLNIQLIFNPEKVLGSWQFSIISSNAMYVNAVNASHDILYKIW